MVREWKILIYEELVEELGKNGELGVIYILLLNGKPLISSWSYLASNEWKN